MRRNLVKKQKLVNAPVQAEVAATGLAKTRSQQLATALRPLMPRLRALGVDFACVVKDPQLQTDGETRLFSATNLKTIDSGTALLQMYLLINGSPKAKLLLHQRASSLLSDAPPLRN